MTRLDLAIQKHPGHEEAIRLFAARDPSGNLKYLHWQIRVLESGQALAPEIADVVDLFHQFGGARRDWPPHRRGHVRSDIYSYRPQDLAHLRDALLGIKRAQDKRRRKRERLYRIEGAVEADVVYEASDLIVRHIRNKQASVHYGLGTKWCISMNRENYFRDYDTANATFFFIERTAPKDDEFDKSAIMVERSVGINGVGISIERATAFTSLDDQIDPFTLVKAYGPRVFDILHAAYVRSESYPGSIAARVYAGIATGVELEEALTIVRNRTDFAVDRFIEAVCCNDAASWSLLEQLASEAESASRAAWKRIEVRGGRRRHRFVGRGGVDAKVRELTKGIEAALSIHPNTPAPVREQLVKRLRQRHVIAESVRIERRQDGSVGIAYRRRGERETATAFHRRRRHLRRRRQFTMTELVRRVGMFERLVKRNKKAIQQLKREQRKKAKR